METHGQARIAWTLVPDKWILALVQGEMVSFGTKHLTTETLAGFSEVKFFLFSYFTT